MTSTRGKTEEINIIGAGIAGLALARILKHRGIPFRIFERRSEQAGYRYGVTLHPEAYLPFLRASGIEEKAFHRAVVAKPRLSSGQGATNADAHLALGKTIRAQRNLLEQFLQPSSVVTCASLKAFEPIDANGGGGVKLQFEHNARNGEPQSPPTETSSFFTVAAEGEHSLLRGAFAQNSKLKVLPYVVYHMRRTVHDSAFHKIYAPHFTEQTNTITHRLRNTRLQIEYVHPNPPNSKHWTIRSTYSRPARTTEDPLYLPDRNPSEAKTIPKALITELDDLKPLPEPFAHAFDSTEVHAEYNLQQAGQNPRTSVLNWLMRTVELTDSDLEDMTRWNVVLVGNAAHAEPILGGNGANAALVDAVELAEAIVRFGIGREAVQGFYKGAKDRWNMGVEESVRNIEGMHGGFEEYQEGRWATAPDMRDYDGYKIMEENVHVAGKI